jgi:hypothetical protein
MGALVHEKFVFNRQEFNFMFYLEYKGRPFVPDPRIVSLRFY